MPAQQALDRPSDGAERGERVHGHGGGGWRLVGHQQGQWKPAWRSESSPPGLTGPGRRLAFGGHGNLLGLRKRTSGVASTQGKVVALAPPARPSGLPRQDRYSFVQMRPD